MLKNITIIGVGLIGGSFGICCKQKKIAAKIIGADKNLVNLERAVELKAIDHYETDLRKAVKGSDLILLATPVKVMSGIVKQIIPHLKKGVIITDTGSVKAVLVKKIEELLPKEIDFVGAHPFSGRELSGIKAASADLFLNHSCIITPTENSRRNALARVKKIWELCGSRVVFMPARLHDQTVAALSHFPHLVAYSLVNVSGRFLFSESLAPEDFISLSAGGFKDLTRIASSSPELWTDICLENKNNLLKILTCYQNYLKEIEKYLQEKKRKELKKEFEKAKQIRERL